MKRKQARQKRPLGPLQTSQFMNTLTELTKWKLHPDLVRLRPCPRVLTNQAPHTHKNDQPLPPTRLLAVLYSKHNPNSRVGCLCPTTTVPVCVCACMCLDPKHTVEALHWNIAMPTQTATLPTCWGVARWRSDFTSKATAWRRDQFLTTYR